MPRPPQEKCKRGHLLENNRYTYKSSSKKTGVDTGCVKCRAMRAKLQLVRSVLKESGLEDQIPTLEQFSKEYFA